MLIRGIYFRIILCYIAGVDVKTTEQISPKHTYMKLVQELILMLLKRFAIIRHIIHLVRKRGIGKGTCF